MRASSALCAAHAAVVLAACTPSEPEIPEKKSIELGDRLGTKVNLPHEHPYQLPVWMPDSRTVIYVAIVDSGNALLGRIATYDITTGTRQVLIQGAELTPSSPALSADGRVLYYVGPAPSGAGHPGNTMYRLALNQASGTPVIVVDSVITILASPDNQRLVYWRWPDGPTSALVAYDIGSGARRAFPDGVPMAFSPDGRQLMYELRSGGYAIASLETGSTQSVDLGLPNAPASLARWDAAGIHVLYRQFDSTRAGHDFYERHLQSGVSDRVYQESFAGMVQEWLAWRPDGSQMAFWVWQCIDPPSCSGGRAAMYVVDLPAGAETWIAGTAELGLEPVYAPDARHLAYLVTAGLYVSDVP